MDAESLSSQVARLFPGRQQRRTSRIGVEHELLTHSAVHGGPVAPDLVREAAGDSTYAASLGFEPGGQVELSLPCAGSPRHLERRLRTDLATLRVDCASVAVELECSPVDHRSVDDVPLQLRSPRYIAMQRHFDTIGPAGRRMMRLTASTQVCLDWWPGQAGLEQWRVLQLSAPFLAAHFARGTGPQSRLATWLAVDPERTAFDDRLLHGEDPVAAYTAFAAGATAFTGTDEHLSTLFPPVRPRGCYLEVRYLDVQPDERLAAVFTVLSRLAHDDNYRAKALSMLLPVQSQLGEHWVAAAMGRREPAELGRELVSMLAVPSGGNADARWENRADSERAHSTEVLMASAS